MYTVLNTQITWNISFQLVSVQPFVTMHCWLQTIVTAQAYTEPKIEFSFLHKWTFILWLQNAGHFPKLSSCQDWGLLVHWSGQNWICRIYLYLRTRVYLYISEVEYMVNIIFSCHRLRHSKFLKENITL